MQWLNQSKKGAGFKLERSETIAHARDPPSPVPPSHPATVGLRGASGEISSRPIDVLKLFSPWVLYDSCDPMDCRPPGFSVHGISQARILEWVAISYSRVSFQPRDGTRVSYKSRHCWLILYGWATVAIRSINRYWKLKNWLAETMSFVLEVRWMTRYWGSCSPENRTQGGTAEFIFGV